MRDFWLIISKNKWRLLLCAVISIATSFAMVYAGYSLSFIVRSYESTGNAVDNLIRDGILVLLIWLGALVFYYSSGVLKAKAMAYMKNDLRRLISRKIVSIRYNEFMDMDSGNYVSWLTNDTESIMEQSFSSLFSVLSGTVTALFSICALSFISIYVGIAAVVLFFFVSVLPQLLTKGLQKESKKRSVAQEKGVESFKDAVMGLPVFLMSNRLTEFSNRIAASSSRLEQSNYNFQKKNVGVQTFVISTSLVGQTILLSLTVLAAILGVAPIGAVLAVGNLAGSFFGNVSEAAGSFTRLKASKTLWEKFKVDSLEETKKALPGKIEEIRIEELSYHYSDSQELHFKDTAFRANGKYAIVGESGSGKTTLVKLLMGLLPDYTGNILYGPSELRDISADSIFENIAYVEQKVYLFQDTVRFNLTLGRDYPEDRINDVLRRCRLESYVASLPNGLDSIIEEDGKNMSGGQRQRIAIARAMLRSIHLIILDEGTSALDEATALEIEQNLVQDPELGVIIITHNLKEKVRDSLDGVYMVGD